MSNDVDIPRGDLARRIVFLKTISDLVGEELNKAKRLAVIRFQKGSSEPARDANDVKLGNVSKSDPKPVAAVVDDERLAEHILQTRPDECITEVRLGDTAQIAAVLTDAGRTDLFTAVKTIPGWLYQEMEAKALAGTSVPGIEVRTPAGYITVRLEQAAKDAVRELLAASPIALGIEAVR
ncbi:hypothetical protein ACIP5Y_21255 [Nocardia sp. NPDC088792]|uniref:hypothetical protein n=1 Tax=Nocardia sp. NPDC088792 TaxID=3364332 RepID=UPI0038159117